MAMGNYVAHAFALGAKKFGKKQRTEVFSEFKTNQKGLIERILAITGNGIVKEIDGKICVIAGFANGVLTIATSFQIFDVGTQKITQSESLDLELSVSIKITCCCPGSLPALVDSYPADQDIQFTTGGILLPPGTKLKDGRVLSEGGLLGDDGSLTLPSTSEPAPSTEPAPSPTPSTEPSPTPSGETGLKPTDPTAACDQWTFKGANATRQADGTVVFNVLMNYQLGATPEDPYSSYTGVNVSDPAGNSCFFAHQNHNGVTSSIGSCPQGIIPVQTTAQLDGVTTIGPIDGAVVPPGSSAKVSAGCMPTSGGVFQDKTPPAESQGIFIP